jgi:L-iditol 2-dehydrogenase
MMKAAKLMGPKSMDLMEVPSPPAPAKGEVLVEILSVGVCGSDLHMYEKGAIGTIVVSEPMTIGHEFSARILSTGPNAVNEHGDNLEVGMRVAVDPHLACGKCEQCLAGNPNLCPNHIFYGVYPTPGALCERMIVKAHNCFPIPEDISDAGGALLETLGVCLHAVDLSRIRVGDTVAIIGCGSVGVLIGRLALLAGAANVWAYDLLEWRTAFARKWGIDAHTVKDNEAVRHIESVTNGRGVDVAIEAAWSDHTVQQSVDMARYGGRITLVGIPPDDDIRMGSSLARRKGLTVRLSRRMKHTYARAIALASGPNPKVPLDDLASHFYSLEQANEAFADNIAYKQDLMKAIIRVNL